MAPLDCHRAGHCLQLGSFLPEEKSRDLGSCGSCRDSPVSWRVPRETLGLFPWHFSGFGHGVPLWASKEGSSPAGMGRKRNNTVAGREGEQPGVPTSCTRQAGNTNP